MVNARAICFSLFKQKVCCALLLALAKAGSSIAARMAIMAMTTSNSMSVNARLREKIRTADVPPFLEPLKLNCMFIRNLNFPRPDAFDYDGRFHASFIKNQGSCEMGFNFIRLESTHPGYCV